MKDEFIVSEAKKGDTYSEKAILRISGTLPVLENSNLEIIQIADVVGYRLNMPVFHTFLEISTGKYRYEGMCHAGESSEPVLRNLELESKTAFKFLREVLEYEIFFDKFQNTVELKKYIPSTIAPVMCDRAEGPIIININTPIRNSLDLLHEFHKYAESLSYKVFQKNAVDFYLKNQDLDLNVFLTESKNLANMFKRDAETLERYLCEKTKVSFNVSYLDIEENFENLEKAIEVLDRIKKDKKKIEELIMKEVKKIGEKDK